MDRNRLKTKFADRSKLVVCAELTGGPGYSYAPIEKFLTAWNEAGSTSLPQGFDFACVTLPQNPGGLANIQPADVINHLVSRNLLGGLDVMPHVTCKDHNAYGITSLLVGHQHAGVETLLAMTGDKPVGAKGVFEVDSVGLLSLIRSMNNESYMKAKPDALDKVHQFYPGAAVSPFKYSVGSQIQQYYKMEKKLASGAQFLITQVGWDWKKSLELFRYLKENGLSVPVIGNVYFLSTLTPAPRLMHDIKLPGCFVSDDFLKKINSEKVDAHLERAAQQVAMYKALGAAGVDIGGVHDFKMFVGIL
ncbi:MAG: methylenetetrahydrofolate reductase, partial [Planctomycetota bacterium]